MLKLHQNVFRMNNANVFYKKISKKLLQLHLNRLKYINMHQNASKCMQNELCKGFVHEIIKEGVFITFKGVIIDETHLPLYGGTPCI